MEGVEEELKSCPSLVVVVVVARVERLSRFAVLLLVVVTVDTSRPEPLPKQPKPKEARSWAVIMTMGRVGDPLARKGGLLRWLGLAVMLLEIRRLFLLVSKTEEESWSCLWLLRLLFRGGVWARHWL